VQNLGINTDTPEVALDVNGKVRAQNGNVNTNYICDENVDGGGIGDNCFNPTSIGGEEGEALHCPTGQALAGIKNEQPVCISVVKVTKTTSCSGGKIMAGIDASGNAICKAL
jgi:hypothetical protein